MPEEPQKPEEKKDQYPLDVDKEPVTTEHSIQIGKEKLEYTVTTGMLPIKSDVGEVEAGIFFVAYKMKTDQPRPLTFSFNGGPGSSSVWLHLGAVGPKVVQMLEDGGLP